MKQIDFRWPLPMGSLENVSQFGLVLAIANIYIYMSEELYCKYILFSHSLHLLSPTRFRI